MTPSNQDDNGARGGASPKGSAIERKFIGWDRSPVATVTEALIGNGSDGLIDLSRLTIVTPGARGGRLLRAAIVDRAESLRQPLLPPRMVTIGELMRSLCRPSAPAASDTARLTSWCRALKETPEAEFQHAMGRRPSTNSITGWMAIAERVDRTHRDLCGEMLLFENVARALETRAGFNDSERWLALARVQDRYLGHLREAGLADPYHDRLTAASAGRISNTGPIVLVGVTELSALARRVLRVAATDPRGGVRTFVLAPSECAPLFDEFGCVAAQAWEGRSLPLLDEHLRIVETQVDQADAALEVLADLGERGRSDEIVIATPDPTIVPLLESRAALCGLRVRNAEGASLSGSRPATLLRAAASYLRTRRYFDLGTLIRHPDVERWMAERNETLGTGGVETWLGTFDEYANSHLPTLIPSRETLAEHTRDDDRGILLALFDAVEALLAPLQRDAPIRPLSIWAEDAVNLLQAVYANHELAAGADRERPEIERVVSACLKLTERAQEFAFLTRTPDLNFVVAASEALDLLVAALDDATATTEKDARAVEMLGWLELTLDDSRHAIITGLNEGHVPGVVHDPLLPASVRSSLGLSDDASRYARDVYLMTLLIQSRETVRLIAGRTSADGEPRKPSRLMFACDDTTAARRVRLWLGKDASSRRPARRPARRRTNERSGFVTMPRSEYQPVEAMRVTWFRDYLSSPYLFYLQHVLRLQDAGEREPELDSGEFGSLLHGCLARLVEDEIATETNPDRVTSFLSEALDQQLRDAYGDETPGAIRIQGEQARERLRALAKWQASEAAAGWRPVHTEWEVPREGVLFSRNGVSMPLLGRIDRIDRNGEGKFRIIDYKTGDKPKSPEDTHRAGPRNEKRWVDLQLPLYRLLAASVVGTGVGSSKVELGYVVLPGTSTGTEFLAAPWDEAMLGSADDAAAEVIRNIQAGNFFEAGDPDHTDGVFASLLGADFVGREAEEDEDDGEGGE